jgi:hypothetical protein
VNSKNVSQSQQISRCVERYKNQTLHVKTTSNFPVPIHTSSASEAHSSPQVMEHGLNAIDIGYSPPYCMFRRTLSNGLLPVEPYMPVYDIRGYSFLNIYPDSSLQPHSDPAMMGATPLMTRDVRFSTSYDGLPFELTVLIADHLFIDSATPTRASG